MKAVILLTLCLVAIATALPTSNQEQQPCRVPGGGELPVGESTEPDACTECTCYLPGEEASCVEKMCGMPMCMFPERVTYSDDICCPYCSTQ